MPKANVVLPGGAKVTIDGTATEVAEVLQRLSQRPDGGKGEGGFHDAKPAAGKRTDRVAGKARSAKTTAHGPAALIRDLVATNFFSAKRGLGDIQKKLEEGGHIYAVTHLSPVVLRLVRARELRRIKDGGTWKYVNR